MEDQNAINIDAGKRLRLVRQQLKLTTRQMGAELGGVDQSYITRCENGNAEIKMSLLSKLYTKFGVMPNYITIGETPMFLGKNHKKETVTDIKQLKADMLAMESKFRMATRKK